MQPRPLLPGDRIALVAPARFTTETAALAAADAVRSAGFEPVVSPGLMARDGQFGGTDAHRAEELNAAFRDPSIRAVWAMRGGYGCARLLPLLDGAALRADPTWIIGFSDVTALHAWAGRQGVAALHAAVAGTLKRTADPELLWSALRNPLPFAQGRGLGLPDDRPVVGGNLSVLFSLLGTPWFPRVDGAWLLVEDLDEYLYHLDRMWNSFKLAGVLERMHGLVVGSFDDLRDNTQAFGQGTDNPFGRDVEDMLREHVPRSKPIVRSVPVGHGRENVPVVLG
jgi:muramoyltetrapeptide carboxypeptidase